MTNITHLFTREELQFPIQQTETTVGKRKNVSGALKRIDLLEPRRKEQVYT